MAFIDPGRGRGPADPLGLAVQLCTLPWLGSYLMTSGRRRRRRSPGWRNASGFLLVRLPRYGEREQTRTEHLRATVRYLGWRQAKALELKELEEFLLARALEHDAPSSLHRLACEYLISAKAARAVPPLPSRM